MNNKNFKLLKSQILQLIPNIGGCIATDRITIDGAKVGYMYRSVPTNDDDSGWRFFAGNESEVYVNDSSNLEIYEVNTIANYDKSIIPYLNEPFGIQFERMEDSDLFEKVTSFPLGF